MNNLEKQKEVLVIHSWGLGDMILLTPVLNLVHTLHPETRFTFMVFQKQSSFPIIYAPYLRRVCFVRMRLFSLLKAIIEIRKTTFDVATFSSGVNIWKAGGFLSFIKAHIKLAEKNKHRFPGMSFYSDFIQNKSRTENNYSLFELAFELPRFETVLKRRNEFQFKPQFFLSNDNDKFVESYLQKHNINSSLLIGIHPGCLAKNKYRRWPVDYFVSLINLIKQNYSCSILVIGGPDEINEAKVISESTNSLFLKEDSLSNVAAIMSHLSFFINTDSGLGHIASCFDIKTLTIFGPGDDNQTAPFSENSNIVRLHLPCSPCINKRTIKCNYECLTQLKPEIVFNNLSKLLLSYP